MNRLGNNRGCGPHVTISCIISVQWHVISLCISTISTISMQEMRHTLINKTI